MKMNLKSFPVLVLVFLLFALSPGVFAQKKPLADDYAKVSVKDKNVIRAARFAVRERAASQGTEVNLLEIKNAKMRLAAGRHYEICLLTNYLNKRSNQLVDQFVRVSVYRDSKNKYSLKNWTQEYCVEE